MSKRRRESEARVAEASSSAKKFKAAKYHSSKTSEGPLAGGASSERPSKNTTGKSKSDRKEGRVHGAGETDPQHALKDRLPKPDTPPPKLNLEPRKKRAEASLAKRSEESPEIKAHETGKKRKRKREEKHGRDKTSAEEEAVLGDKDEDVRGNSVVTGDNNDDKKTGANRRYENGKKDSKKEVQKTIMKETHNNGENKNRSKESDDKARSRPEAEHSKLKDGTGNEIQTLRAPEVRTKDPNWSIEKSSGTRLKEFAPILTDDEEHVILAYSSCIKVYARATSLQLRTLEPHFTGSITSMTVSQAKPERLYISSNNGVIEQWDWKEGSRLGSWDGPQHISILTSCWGLKLNDETDVVFTVSRTDSVSRIAVHKVPVSIEDGKVKSEVLNRTKRQISELEVLDSGRHIIASSPTHLLIATRNKTEEPQFSALSFNWTRFFIPDITILTFDGRVSEGTGGKSKSPKKAERRGLDIAVGGGNGVLYLFRDILDTARTASGGESMTATPTRLHWHRHGVLAVRWSADGNYLISGGSETVLVLWQLDTGRQQFLPHLSAPILDLTVSPSGTSYGIRLADNSFMVMSTMELQPTANIPGIMVPSQRDSSKKSVAISRTNRATIRSATVPPQILFAVPGALPSHESIAPSKSASYLQMFDPRLGVQIHRQALTRTQVIDRIDAPDGQVIEEPNVVLLQTSSDGHWLATVEEWTPPLIDRLQEDGRDTPEVCLKFWEWNDEVKTWELVSRVDQPHPGGGVVRDLLPLSKSTAFITTGDDAGLCVWKPRARIKGNIKMKDKRGSTLTSWGCDQAMALPSYQNFLTSARSDFFSIGTVSNDDSLAVLTYGSKNANIVCLADLTTYSVQSVRRGMYSGVCRGIGVMDRYLVTLAEQLCVWDLVNDRINYAFSLQQPPASRDYFLNPRLAVDPTNKMFALSLPIQDEKRQIRSHIVVFDVANPVPLFTTKLALPVEHLLASERDRSFYVVDSDAQIYHIKQHLTAYQPLELTSAGTTRQKPGLEGIYGTEKTTSVEESSALTPFVGTSNQRVASGDLEEPHIPKPVSQHALREIFERNQPLALASVSSLFEQVAELVSKPARSILLPQ